MPKREPNHHGILIVDKPGRTTTGLASPIPTDIPNSPKPQSEEKALPTSHDIVQMARRWCQQRRVGHTGTLDPMASGVLVLCLGNATRLVEYYQNHTKQYYAEVCLGIATDTYDAMGTVTQSAPVPHLTQSVVEDVLAEFRGEIEQIPPVYSAIKQGGESLHRKARRGEEVTLKPRSVTFHQLELVEFVPPDRLKLRVICSPGTYIRSLAHDIGQALKTRGYLDRLRREASGSFSDAQAHTPTQITTAVEADTLSELIKPPGFGLGLPIIRLAQSEIQRFGYGQVVLLNSAQTAQALANRQAEPQQNARSEITLAAAHNIDTGGFAGIIRHLGEADKLERQAAAQTTQNRNSQKQTADDGTPWKAEKWLVSS